MLVLQIMFGVIYSLATLAACFGAFGLGTLLPMDFETPSWPVRIARWAGSVLVFALLLGTAITMQWGPFSPGQHCSRSRPCLQVQVSQPTSTVTMKADLPGTPTAEDCRAELERRRAAGQFPAPSVVVGECS